MAQVQTILDQWINRHSGDGAAVTRNGLPGSSASNIRSTRRTAVGNQSIEAQPTPLQPGGLQNSVVKGRTGSAGQPLGPVHRAAASAAGASTASSATITANDFLTLLVTEIQNQDPTSNTDPNAYINQLVQVNSLEQLISINSELGVPKGNGSSMGSATQGTASRVATAMDGQAAVPGKLEAMQQAARAYASPERRHLPFHAATQQPTGPGVR